MAKRPPVKSGDEVDVHSKHRHAVNWKPGQVSQIKRRTRRRERQLGKKALEEYVVRRRQLGL